MTQQEKQLLLVDLCARLPYGVICYWRIGSELTLNLTEYNGQLTCINKVEIEDSSDYYYDCYFNVCNDSNGNSFQNEDVPVEIVKPYLRPMSSMTDEEIEIYRIIIKSLLENSVTDNIATLYNFLNSKHLDYNGLIHLGLAVEVTEENNPYKE